MAEERHDQDGPTSDFAAYCREMDAPDGLTLAPPEVRRYLTYMKTRVSSKGQIVLPAELRELDHIKSGQEFEVERLDRGEYRLIRRTSGNEGVIDWLLACPEKGFFVPLESESTDTL